MFSSIQISGRSVARFTFVIGFIVIALLSVATNTAATPQATAAIFHVATNGSDVNGCGSAGSPCKSIQFAVNQSNSGDTLRVAAGTHTYNAETDICTFLVTRSVVCVIDKNLTILGGYDAENWTIPSPVANLSIIDGQNAQRGVHVEAYNQTVHLTMEGFTIQNGRAFGNQTGDNDSHGGGMRINQGSVTLRDMIFKNNQAVGRDNNPIGRAGAGGGLAIVRSKTGSSLLERIVFQDNQAIGGSGSDRGGVAIGGGLFTSGATVNSSYLTFANNQALAGSSGGNGSGAGLLADALGGGIGFGLGTHANFSNVTVIGNRAVGGNAGQNAGGAFGGGIHAEESALTLNDALINENTAIGGNGVNGGVTRAGGLEVFNGNFTIERTRFIANWVTSGASTGGGTAGAANGGGAYFSATKGSYKGTIVNSIFADNHIEFGANGSKSLGGGGGGMTVAGMFVEIIHATFSNNNMGNGLLIGHALNAQEMPGFAPGTTDIKYSIFANHTGRSDASTVHVASGSTINFTRGLFAANTKDTNSDGVPVNVGTFTGLDTLISATSPGFVSPGAPNYNYRLTAGSAAIDQAAGSSTAVDIDNLPRPVGRVRDLGAHEFINLDKKLYIPVISR